VLLCGDLLQLPPVEGDYCIHAPIWESAKFQVMVLQDVHRQKDNLFLNILAKARMGEISQEDVEFLKKRCLGQCPPYIKPTKLYALKKDVQFVNDIEYERVLSKTPVVRSYTTMYSGTKGKTWADGIGIPEVIEIAVGSQVMVTMNIEFPALINGTRGVVTQVSAHTVEIKTLSGEVRTIEMYTLRNENEHGTNLCVRFMPLCFAWAITHHKSQGATLDAVELELGRSVFAPGQAYTALSRCKSMENISLMSISARAFRAHPEIKKFYEKHSKKDD
jgi:ATP-dependent DNA helicase PIF1